MHFKSESFDRIEKFPQVHITASDSSQLCVSQNEAKPSCSSATHTGLVFMLMIFNRRSSKNCMAQIILSKIGVAVSRNEWKNYGSKIQR